MNESRKKPNVIFNGTDNDREQWKLTEQELSFAIFVIYSLAEKWEKTPTVTYKILNESNILDDYIIACYDTLHTQGRECLVEDITGFVKEKGITI